MQRPHRTLLFVAVVAGFLAVLVSSFANSPLISNTPPFQSSSFPSSRSTRTCTSTSSLYYTTEKKQRFASFFQKEEAPPDTAASTAPILVKPRPTVSLDSETGKFVRPTYSKVSENKPAKKSDWNSFKSAFYGASDSIQILADTLSSGEDGEFIGDGYGDTIEDIIFSESSGETPGQRLMKEYQRQAPLQSNVDEEAERTELSAFDSIKEGIYGTVDSVSGLFSSDQDDHYKPPPPIASFKPVTEASLAASREVKIALPNLTSTNIIKKIKARRSIEQWEEEQQVQKGNQKENVFSQIKSSFYAVSDVVNRSLETVTAIPEAVDQSAVNTQRFVVSSAKWVVSFPRRSQQFVDEVGTVRRRVQSKADKVQASVENGIQITRTVIEDVKNIPDTVQNKVLKMKRTANETVTAAEDAVYNVKVLAKLENPKPKPPKTRPPKLVTAKDIAFKVARSAGAFTAKGVWTIGKGAASLGWKEAKSMFTGISSKRRGVGIEKKTPEEMVRTVAASAARFEVGIDSEVAAALELADEALELASDNTMSSPEDVDDFMRRAKEATVVQATVSDISSSIISPAESTAGGRGRGYQLGDLVEIIAGSYRGHSGIIVKVTAKKVAINIEELGVKNIMKTSVSLQT